jgi:GNAT superfamily N-acetyltransferase
MIFIVCPPQKNGSVTLPGLWVSIRVGCTCRPRCLDTAPTTCVLEALVRAVARSRRSGRGGSLQKSRTNNSENSAYLQAESRVDEGHQGKGLGSELILAGFAQAPWKDLKDRKVTEAGAATLRSAYRLAKEATKRTHFPASNGGAI